MDGFTTDTVERGRRYHRPRYLSQLAEFLAVTATLALLAFTELGDALLPDARWWIQALVYPMLDDRMITPSSGWDVPIWPPVSNDFGWNAYLEGRRGHDDVPIYAAPARAEDLSCLPPTFICVGALDGFLDEDVNDATRRLRAGVPVEPHVYPGARTAST